MYKFYNVQIFHYSNFQKLHILKNYLNLEKTKYLLYLKNQVLKKYFIFKNVNKIEKK
jgi:hypothetical protein